MDNSPGLTRLRAVMGRLPAGDGLADSCCPEPSHLRAPNSPRAAYTHSLQMESRHFFPLDPDSVTRGQSKEATWVQFKISQSILFLLTQPHPKLAKDVDFFFPHAVLGFRVWTPAAI